MQVPVRIPYIDTVKGVAILLMIFGHMRFHNLNWFVYSFHMPLFFILSGFFFNPQKPIVKRIMKLIFPYIITAMAILSVEVIFQVLNYFLTNEAFSTIKVIRIIAASVCGCVKPVGIGNYLIPDVGPIWFLLALALGYLILWILYRMEMKYRIGAMTVIGCVTLAILGWVISMFRGQIPFSINQALIVPLFLCVGGEIRRFMTQNKVNTILLMLSVIVWGIQLYIQKHVQFMSMGQMGSILYPIYVIGAISASYIIILIFKYLNSKFKFRILNKLGTATLVILCVHTIDLFGIEPRLRCILFNIGLDKGELYIYGYKILLYASLLFYIFNKRRNGVHTIFRNLKRNLLALMLVILPSR